MGFESLHRENTHISQCTLLKVNYPQLTTTDLIQISYFTEAAVRTRELKWLCSSLKEWIKTRIQTSWSQITHFIVLSRFSYSHGHSGTLQMAHGKMELKHEFVFLKIMFGNLSCFSEYSCPMSFWSSLKAKFSWQRLISFSNLVEDCHEYSSSSSHTLCTSPQWDRTFLLPRATWIFETSFTDHENVSTYKACCRFIEFWVLLVVGKTRTNGFTTLTWPVGQDDLHFSKSWADNSEHIYLYQKTQTCGIPVLLYLSHDAMEA